ncbi:MAG: putative dehydrogenase [Verrucomicrobiales bacterium]|jgi:predicted dehydrogenase
MSSNFSDRPATFPTSSRRRFLKGAASTAFAAPFVTSGLRADPPSGKLNHASFGAGGMAGADIGSLSSSPHFHLAAVADVDTIRLDALKKKFPDVRCYQDWRELLEKEGDKIDSVNVSTPDHMHGPIGMTALQMGKHVYGQKPLTQNLHECRQVTLKARESGLMTQMGIQVSSAFSERLGVAAVQAGAIGKVKEVHTFSNKKWGDMEPLPEREDAVPKGFSWDQWLGVATQRKFLGNGYYHPGNWRKRRDFGTGTLGDMGCHIFSGWFRALALTTPISVQSFGPASNQHNWAINGKVEYVYPRTEFTENDTVMITWYDGDQRPPEAVTKAMGKIKLPGQGSVIIGTEGAMLAPHGSTPRFAKNGEEFRYKFPKLEPRNHYHEFIECCREGKAKPSANFDYAGPLTEAVLLGCLASLFPEKLLQFDSENVSFSNSEEATAAVKRNYRAGWEVAGF